MKHRICWLWATCCGLGYSPFFPGTCGALLGIPIYLVIAFYAPPAWQTMLIAAALIVVSAVTVALGPWAEAYFAEKDASKFVTDEVAGFLLTVLLFRAGDPLTTVLWAFPVTRVIDIIKVPPAKQLEKLPSGWGVLADDLLGSVYAAGLLHVVRWQFPSWFG